MEGEKFFVIFTIVVNIAQIYAVTGVILYTMMGVIWTTTNGIIRLAVSYPETNEPESLVTLYF